MKKNKSTKFLVKMVDEVRKKSLPKISPYDIEHTLNNMKQTREEAGLTQDKLAELLNVDRCMISKWERRLENPQFDNLVRLYRILHGITV